MSSIKHVRNDGDDFVTKKITTDTQVAEAKGSIPYRQLLVESSDGKIYNDGVDTEEISISIVDGLEVAKGSARSNANILDYSGQLTLSINSTELTKELTNGTTSFNITTDQKRGSTILIEAMRIDGHAVKRDSEKIDVIKK